MTKKKREDASSSAAEVIGDAEVEVSGADARPSEASGEEARASSSEAEGPPVEAAPSAAPASGAASSEAPWWRRRSWEALAFWASVLVPLGFYVYCIPQRITYGDAPEILSAVYLRGIIHPSGYPLYTLLGQLFVHLPLATPHWHLAFFLSALPGAVACGLIFATLRHLRVNAGVAATAALSFGLNDSVVFQSVKVEVYSLHCVLLAAVVYFVVRYALDRDRMKWAYLAVLAQCLALGDHLTSVFMVVPLTVALITIAPRAFFRPRSLLIFTAIAALGASVYLYMPLAASRNMGEVIDWNRPETWELFWYHVRGAEYSKFRDFSKLAENLAKFGARPGTVFVPGIMVVMVVGAIELFLRQWKVALMLLLFMVGSLLYVSTYNINDISTYYGGLYVAGLVYTGVGADWILHARIPATSPRARRWWGVAVAVLLILPLSLLIRNRGERYHDVLAQDMSEAVAADLPPKAIVLTSVDGHSFPLWYQAYMVHPEKDWIMIDQVLFKLKDKKWYRDHLRRRHPDAVFPTEEEMDTLRLRSNGWESWMIERNRDRYGIYALLARRWTVPGTYPVNRGWHFEIRPNSQGNPDQDRTRDGMHIYMSRFHPVGSRNYFHDSRATYPSGDERLACVTEWLQHKDLTATWTFVGPGGKVVRHKPHFVPSSATISWEFLEVEEQVPGPWTCEVRVGGRVELSQAFVLQ